MFTKNAKIYQFYTINVITTNNSVANVAGAETTKTAKLLWKKKVKKRKGLESVKTILRHISLRKNGLDFV